MFKFKTESKIFNFDWNQRLKEKGVSLGMGS